ncbi:MAG: OsmC family protein [Anaerolineae bacterium]|nr:OsmC family protein [Anaerolineae bacterium]
MAKAKVTWIGPALRLTGEANDGPAIIIDGVRPPTGTHSGPAPMELILLSVAGCSGMDVISILSKKRQPFTGMQVNVTAEQADKHPMIYTHIHLEYVLYGQGLSGEAVERAIGLSEEKYCSVMAMLRPTVKITHSYRVVEDQPLPNMPGGSAGE